MSPPTSTIRSEGGLIPRDLVDRIAMADKTVPGLTPADYRLDAGQTLGEAISRSWNRLLPVWHTFRAELAKLPADDPATTLTRDRLLQPLLQELGYGRVPTARQAIEVDERSYAISHLYGDTPIHLLGARTSLEERTAGQRGAARSSPHGLVQDLLNRSKPHLWALLSNGLVLRLLRDHHSLTTQAYLEVDLEALFEGEHYADFALLWLVFHQSRVEADKPDECWLEKWFKLSREEGLAALDDLRDGVVAAIELLGRGFLRHPRNQALHDDLAQGVLDKQDYYRELLRLAYRLIFLFSAEERTVRIINGDGSVEEMPLLLDPSAPAAARDRYRRFYATRRLRELAGTSRGGPHGDLWQGLRVVMNGLDDGCPALGLPALGSFLWERATLPHLDRCELANADLLAAIRALSYLERHKQRFPVSWRAVAADELGSIYESLLELYPRLDVGAGAFDLTTVAGNERKKTGSYYTPTSLVDCLLDGALVPVIDAAVKGKSRTDAEAALLALKIVDPACGSGHFLVAAARRLAHRLVTVRTGDDEPSPRELQRARRDVVGHCIFGVDLNEMAVELCKVALWMEALEPGKPLSFLDAHVQHGNSLIGATPALIARGIPDDAWDPIEGDKREIARALKKRNRDARKAAEQPGQADMFAILASRGPRPELSAAARDALAGSDDAVGDVRARKRRWEVLQNSQAFQDARSVADCWCAAFVWLKREGALAAEAPTDDAFARIRKDPASASKTLRRQVEALAWQYGFFHWHLAFPDVFTARIPSGESDVTGWDGGFDCVLGNPPWERVKLQEQEFFAGKHDEIATAENAAKRKKLIAKLPETDPALWDAWTQASRRAEGESHFIRESCRYPLCGKGDINTYSIFAEHNRSILGRQGHAGFIVPTGIVTDDTTKEFFESLVSAKQLISVYDFLNTGAAQLFREVGHDSFRFTLLSLGPNADRADLVFDARTVSDLSDSNRHCLLTSDDFTLLNPNTRTCPTFRSRRDAEINRAIYRRLGVLQREDTSDGDPWGTQFMRMFDMANDSGLFKTRAQLERDGWRLNGNVFFRDAERFLPLLEAKMIHHFDHRFGDYSDRPNEKEGTDTRNLPMVSVTRLADPAYTPLSRYWVSEAEVAARLAGRWNHKWLLGWRDVCRSVLKRTAIASVTPQVAVGHTMPLMMFDGMDGPNTAALYANLCSFVLDYVTRQKLGGTHLTYGYLKQLPIFSPAKYQVNAPWSDSTVRDWMLPRVLELSCTTWDLQCFASDIGYDGPPFRWDPVRRSILRAELDAAFFHLYGIERGDTDYIMETFPLVRKDDEEIYGEYHTKRLVLERYDALAAATASGKPYVSPLSPPPGDRRAAHPEQGASR
jgi:hypothetical protein